MKDFMKNLGAYIVALLMVASFYGAMLYTGVATRSLMMLIGVISFALYISFSIKKKSIPITIMGFAISTILFYGVWGLNLLISFLLNFLQKINFPGVSYLLIGLLVTITLLIFRSIWKFLSGLYVIVKPDEAHIITRIDKSISVYSGADISDRSPELRKAYRGNHYWDFSGIKILKMVLGMIVQKTRFDDIKFEIKDVKVKSKNKAELIIGKAVFHFVVNNPIKVAKIWPGKDMDIEEFKKEIFDIVEESVEISVTRFTAKQLTGGSEEVNLAFKKELIKKLSDNYGIEIINAKLSQEKGDVIDLIKDVETEKLRQKAEIAKQQAEEAIETAKEKKQQKINAVMKTEAEGRKTVVETDADAESQKIKKILEAQASGKDLFLATHPISAQVEIAKALSNLYKNATTIVNSGNSGDLIGNILAIGKSLGVNEKSIKAINDNS